MEFEMTRCSKTFVALVSLLAFGGCAAPVEASNAEEEESASTSQALTAVDKNQNLSCTGNACTIKNMPLIAQSGTATDPLDADVAFAGGIACANASHTMVMSAAWKNRKSTVSAKNRSSTFVGLPARNKAGRHSWVLRENLKNNGSYDAQWHGTPPAPFPKWSPPAPPAVHPAYSMQNLIYDLDPSHTELNCDPGTTIDNWWTCMPTNNYGSENYIWIDPYSWDWVTSSYLASLMDNAWVPMVSFFWQTKTTVYDNPWSKTITYSMVNPHKMAVSGYDRSQAFDLTVNNPGSGAKEKINLNYKQAFSGTSWEWIPAALNYGDVFYQEVLPGNATAWPSVNFYGDFDANVNLLQEVDYFWLK